MNETRIEILEVGDDGSFDAPSEFHRPKKADTQPLDYSNFDWSAITREDNMEVLQCLNCGEYVVYHTEKGKIWVIVRLDTDDNVQLLMKDNTLQLRTEIGKFDIKLPSEVNTSGKLISSKQWNGFVTILIE